MYLSIYLKTVFCKRFCSFWTKLFLLTFIIFCQLFAENITGYISDQNDNPIPYVHIQNISKNNISFADESGYFTLSDDNIIGDTLFISRIGYHSQKNILGINTQFQIKLTPQNIALNTIIIQGEFENHQITNQKFIKIEKNSVTRDINHRAIFSSIPGAYIKSYGGSAGISTLSMDGAPTRHTKILIDGFDITNAQNSQVDISQLPPNFIENISYNPYNNSTFAKSGSEGSVNISPWKDKNSAYYGIGSFGKQNYGLSLTTNLSRVNINFLAGKSHDDGNYKAINPMTTQEIFRKNNHLDREYLSIKMNSVITQSMFSKLLYLYSSQDRGVAGQIWSPTPKSFRKDKFHLLGLKLGWVTKLGAGYLQSTIRNSNDHFYNSSDFGFPYDTKHDVKTNRYDFTQNINLFKNLTYLTSININDNNLKSPDTQNRSRLSYIFSNSMELKFNKIKIIPTHKYNYSNHLYSHHTWNYSLKYSIDRWILNSISFNNGLFFHYPTFNDLYWKPGGNEDLKHEETISKSFDFHFSILKNKDLKILIYDKNSENLIQWLPSQSYWRPKNINKSTRKGLKILYTFSLSKFQINGFINYSYNFSEDHDTKTALLYSPKHSGGMNLDFSKNKWKLHYQVHFTDERISMHSWPEDIVLERLTEQTIGCSYDFQFNYGKISTSLLIENLTDKQYETIKGYPEPGRTIKLRIQYYLNYKNKKKEK